MIIAIDLDKTLFNCNSVVYKILNKLQFPKKSEKKLIYKTVSNKEQTNVGFLKFFSRMFNPDKYEEVANAVAVIKKWKEQNSKIIFLSSRPHNIKAIRNSAVNWLNSHNVPYSALVLGCKNKGKFCKEFNVDVLIDDNKANCKSAIEEQVNAINLTNKNEIKLNDENKNCCFFKANSWDKIDFFLGLIKLKYCKAPGAYNNKISIFDYVLADNKIAGCENGLADSKIVECANILSVTKNPYFAKEIVFNKNYNLENINSLKKK